MRRGGFWIVAACLLAIPGEVGAQSVLHRADSILTLNYRKGDIDTAYITRPATKWTVTARMNVSGSKIEAEGTENGQHFKAEMEANRKATISLGVSYLGLSLSASLNPASVSVGGTPPPLVTRTCSRIE